MVAALDGFALVVVFLAFCQGNDNFDEFPLGEELGWHNGHALLFGGGKPVDLFAAGQEFSYRGVDTPSVCLASCVEPEGKAGVIEP